MLFGQPRPFIQVRVLETELALRLAVAVPGGVVLGIALAWLSMRITPFVTGTLGGNLMEFATAFAVWILLKAEPVADTMHRRFRHDGCGRTAGLRQSPRDAGAFACRLDVGRFPS